ncbi:MAG: YkvA family protein [Saprospiraceae bacterium]|jgi:uncharacterized membrane protein YkvA (DUF1232 family)
MNRGQPFSESEYSTHFSVGAFWKAVRKFAVKAGQQSVYISLLLYFAAMRNDTPFWAKNIVLGALGYLIAPIDALPDLTPFLGYTDDIGVLGFALVTISAYVNDEVKDKAKNTMTKWFRTVDEEGMQEVENRL